MDKAHSFLDKYKKLAPPNDTVRRAVAKLVTEMFGVDVGRGDVEVRNNIVWLNVSPTIKNTVLVNKTKLMSALKEHLGEKGLPRDIR